jgi:murein DD-endopeptidase MepM/ murein hydrolase activator NlpD
VTGPGGALGQATRTVVVLRTRWTTDYITLPPPPPPDPNAPPPPPDETPLLPVLYAGVTPRKWTDGWFAPLPPPLAVTGYFGEQRSFNGGPVGGHHGGTDLGAEARTPVFATNDGVVAMSGLYAVRGNIVAIDHGSGVFSLYGHLRERVVQVGDKVTKGQVIGYVGSTGQSTGPHLHWEMAVGGILVDGLRWLDGSQGF